MRPAGFNEYGRIVEVVLRRPAAAWRDQRYVDANWRELNYLGPPALSRAAMEYRQLEQVFEALDARIHYLPPADELSMDGIYVRDASLVTPRGVILCAMGKQARSNEPASAEVYYREHQIEILGSIHGEGRLEGGDLVWLNERCVVAGQGYRSNQEGIRQLQALLGDEIEVVSVPLPHWNGAGDVFHLMSMISPLDRDLLLVYSRLLPVPFREWLLENEYCLVEVPDEEYESMACNVLAIAPRHGVQLRGNPVTEKRLREAGVTVELLDGAEIAMKGCGGPTCLTRPLVRARS